MGNTSLVCLSSESVENLANPRNQTRFECNNSGPQKRGRELCTYAMLNLMQSWVQSCLNELQIDH